MGKHCVPCLLLPLTLDAQFGTPNPRFVYFDTDIGAFSESSTVLSPKGLMAHSIGNNDAVQGETFLLGQIFVFGGFACGPIRLAIWSRSKATPLAIRSDLGA